MPRFPMSICLFLALIMLHLAPLALVKCKSSAQMSLTPVTYQSTQVSWSLDYILQQGSSSRQRISPHFTPNSSYHHTMYTYNLYKSWWNWASAFTEDCICWILYLHLVDLCSSQIVVTVRKWMLLLKFLCSTKLPLSYSHSQFYMSVVQLTKPTSLNHFCLILTKSIQLSVYFHTSAYWVHRKASFSLRSL